MKNRRASLCQHENRCLAISHRFTRYDWNKPYHRSTAFGAINQYPNHVFFVLKEIHQTSRSKTNFQQIIDFQSTLHKPTNDENTDDQPATITTPKPPSGQIVSQEVYSSAEEEPQIDVELDEKNVNIQRTESHSSSSELDDDGEYEDEEDEETGDEYTEDTLNATAPALEQIRHDQHRGTADVNEAAHGDQENSEEQAKSEGPFLSAPKTTFTGNHHGLSHNKTIPKSGEVQNGEVLEKSEEQNEPTHRLTNVTLAHESVSQNVHHTETSKTNQSENSAEKRDTSNDNNDASVDDSYGDFVEEDYEIEEDPLEISNNTNNNHTGSDPESRITSTEASFALIESVDNEEHFTQNAPSTRTVTEQTSTEIIKTTAPSSFQHIDNVTESSTIAQPNSTASEEESETNASWTKAPTTTKPTGELNNTTEMMKHSRELGVPVKDVEPNINSTMSTESDTSSNFVTVNPSMFYGIPRQIVQPPSIETALPASAPDLTIPDSTTSTSPSTTTTTEFIKTVSSTSEPSTISNGFALDLEDLFQVKLHPQTAPQKSTVAQTRDGRRAKMFNTEYNDTLPGDPTLTVSNPSSHGISSVRSDQKLSTTSTTSTASSVIVVAPASTSLPSNYIPSLFGNGDPLSSAMKRFPWSIHENNQQTFTLSTTIPIATTITPLTTEATTTTVAPKLNLFAKKQLPSLVSSTRPPIVGPTKKFNLFASLTNSSKPTYTNKNRDQRSRPELRPFADGGRWQPSIEAAQTDRDSLSPQPPEFNSSPRTKSTNKHRPEFKVVTPRPVPIPPPRIFPLPNDSGHRRNNDFHDDLDDVDLIHQGTPPAPRNGKQPISNRARTTLLMCASLVTGAAIFFATLLAVCRRRAKNARLLRRRAVEAFIHDASSEASSNYGYGGSAYSYGRKGLLGHGRM